MTLSPTFNSLLDFLESVIWLLNSSRTSELDVAIKKTTKTNCWRSRAVQRSGMDTILCGASAVLPPAARLRGRGFLSQTGWLTTRLVFWLPASPSDVRAGRSHQCAFTGRFHVSFNEETAGLAAGYKQQADWNTQIWISCIRRQVRMEASLS